MKTLKFFENLVPLVLDGSKTTTWRLFDDKDLQQGDKLTFICKQDGKEFANAEIVASREVAFRDLTDDDWEGHEKFESDDEMYEAYSKYYSAEVNKNTIVKIVKFKRI